MEPLDEPIRKVLVNVYDADYEEMRAIHGWGWTGIVRDLIRQYLKERREARDEYDR